MKPDAEPNKLPCPMCGSQDSRTLKIEFYPVRLVTWRRRGCQDCGARFSTMETYSPDPTIRLNPGRLQLVLTPSTVVDA